MESYSQVLISIMAETLKYLSSFNFFWIAQIFVLVKYGDMTHISESKLAYNLNISCADFDIEHCRTVVSMCLYFRPNSMTTRDSSSVLFSYFDKGSSFEESVQLHVQHAQEVFWVHRNEKKYLLFEIPRVLRNESSWRHLCFLTSSSEFGYTMTLSIEDGNGTISLPLEDRAIGFHEAPTRSQRQLKYTFGGGNLSSENQRAPLYFECVRDVTFTVYSNANNFYELAIKDDTDDICQQTCLTNKPCQSSDKCLNFLPVDAGGIDRCECLEGTVIGTTCRKLSKSKDFFSIGWVVLLTAMPFLLVLISLCIYCVVAGNKLRRQSAEDMKKKGQPSSKVDTLPGKRATISSKLPSSLSSSIELEWDPQAENKIKNPELEWDHDAHNPDISGYFTECELETVPSDAETQALNVINDTTEDRKNVTVTSV
ncbi:uncharacterized protein [Apostichopus japonicus]|uniref:uncharacterized protein isoform X1 n=1 Tax=Stichopus japonicus TaxID=307972 RepID=UPI003AB15F72